MTPADTQAKDKGPRPWPTFTSHTTGKLSTYEACLGVLFALLFYPAAHTIAGVHHHD